MFAMLCGLDEPKMKRKCLVWYHIWFSLCQDIFAAPWVDMLDMRNRLSLHIGLFYLEPWYMQAIQIADKKRISNVAMAIAKIFAIPLLVA